MSMVKGCVAKDSACSCPKADREGAERSTERRTSIRTWGADCHRPFRQKLISPITGYRASITRLSILETSERRFWRRNA
jgi:hypothetical protein